MELEGAQVGTRVRVQVDYRDPQRRGAVGTIQKRYGVAEYKAFEVLFADGLYAFQPLILPPWSPQIPGFHHYGSSADR